MAEVTRRKYLGGSAVVLGGLLAAACGETKAGSGGGETQPAAQPKPAAQTQAPAQPAMTIGAEDHRVPHRLGLAEAQSIN